MADRDGDVCARGACGSVRKGMVKEMAEREGRDWKLLLE